MTGLPSYRIPGRLSENHWRRQEKLIKSVQTKKWTKPKAFKIGDQVYLSIKYPQSIQPSKKLGPKHVGLFSIKRIINWVTVELELLKSLRCIHPIFHCSFLKSQTQSLLHPMLPLPPKPLMTEGEQHFEMKDILDSRKHGGKLQYLVAWKHFPPPETEWRLKHIKAAKLLKLLLSITNILINQNSSLL